MQPLFEKRPVKKKKNLKKHKNCGLAFVPVCVYMCQPVSKIFIGFGLTVYLENSLHMISAEKKVKGNVCCLTKWQAI